MSITSSQRRLWLKGVAVLIAAPLTAAGTARAVSRHTAKEKVIKVHAKRFQYEPNEITLKVGQTVMLELTSEDFIHGLNIPDLKTRTDLVPGRITKLRVKFSKPGTYDFLCDNFCGDGHEEMSGKFVVT